MLELWYQVEIDAIRSLFQREDAIALSLDILDILKWVLVVFPHDEILGSDSSFAYLLAWRSRSKSCQNYLLESGTVAGTEKSSYIEDGTDTIEEEDFHLTFYVLGLEFSCISISQKKGVLYMAPSLEVLLVVGLVTFIGLCAMPVVSSIKARQKPKTPKGEVKIDGPPDGIERRTGGRFQKAQDRRSRKVYADWNDSIPGKS